MSKITQTIIHRITLESVAARIVEVLPILILCFSTALAEDQILLGVLEQPQSGWEEHDVVARILFHKQGNMWRALGIKPFKPSATWNVESIEWTVALDGKKIGNVQIEDPSPTEKYNSSWHYRRDKKHTINTESLPPKINNVSKSFAGWVHTPDYRPLVIISEPNFEDPEKWEEFEPSASYKERLFPFLKVAVGRINLIRFEYEPDYHSLAYDPKPSETILHEGHRSSDSRELVSIGLDSKIIKSDGPPSPEWSGNWFLIHDKNIDFIGREMEFVDSGDYDNDGKPEFLFWHSGYNEDGYVLIYGDFRKKAEYF